MEFLILGALVGIVILISFFVSYRNKSEALDAYRQKEQETNRLKFELEERARRQASELKQQRANAEYDIRQRRASVENDIERRYSSLNHRLAEIEKREKDVTAKEAYYTDAVNTLDKLIEDKCRAYPHMAAIMADLLTIHYERAAKYLETKPRPAYHEAYRIRDLREETSKIIEEKKNLEYVLKEIQERGSVVDLTSAKLLERDSLHNDNARLIKEIEELKDKNEELITNLHYWNTEAEQAKKSAEHFLPKIFLDGHLASEYIRSMSTTRLQRALNEEISFKVPLDLKTTVRSSSGEVYMTSLSECECEDFKRHRMPCKHMIALAIKVKALSPYQRELEELFRKTGYDLALITEKESAVKEMRRKQGETKAELNELKKVIEEKQQSYPWLASLIASYRTAKYDMRVKTPATKRELTAAIKRAEKEKALLANQLAIYEYMFPILNSFKELPPDSIVATLSDAKDTGFNYNWLSEEEYKILTSAEKQQLWIKNYFAKRSKNAWEAGIKYERYIGYLCEKAGCTVKYTGALLKLNDMGRDLIATKDNTIYIIQCKRFSEGKEIHENHLFQLFGSTCHYSAEHPNKKVIGVFVTTSRLSNVARECANKLDILLYENVEFKEYPVIKCNIGKTGEKIYHLPFDQQYDNVTIKADNNEMYIATIKEAERHGFRHAMKHNFVK